MINIRLAKEKRVRKDKVRIRPEDESEKDLLQPFLIFKKIKSFLRNSEDNEIF